MPTISSVIGPVRVAVFSVSAVFSSLLGKALNAHPDVDVVGSATVPTFSPPQTANVPPLLASVYDTLVVDVDVRRESDLRALARLRDHAAAPLLVLAPVIDPALTTKLHALGYPTVKRRPDLQHLTSSDALDALVRLILAVAQSGPPRSTRRNDEEARHHEEPAADTDGAPTPKPPHLKPVAPAKPAASTPPRTPTVPVAGPPPRPATLLLVIGASTGGPQAVRRTLQLIPPDDRWAIAIVQHISPGFADGYASWLAETTGHPARIAQHGQLITGGSVVVAPGDTHLTVRRGSYHLNHGAKHLFQRPSVDILFESAAEAFGETVVAILLTGMGRDGGMGCRKIVDNGGYTVVQDENSSVIYGMPRAAVEQGGASHVADLEAIGPHAVERLNALWKKYGLHPRPNNSR